MPGFGRRRTYYGRRRYRRRGTRSTVRWAGALASAAALLALLFAVLVIPQAGGPPGLGGAPPMLDAALSDTAAALSDTAEVVSDTAEAALSNTTAAVLPLLPPPPPPLNASDVEYYIHLYTNEHRAYGGLHPLTRVAIIDGIARGHSEDMAARGYFEHDTPEGLDPTARGNAAGYDCRKDYGSYYTYGLAENIHYASGMGGGASDLARHTVSDWMQSPGHRANIMDPAYDRIGVGVAISGGGTIYATQNFC